MREFSGRASSLLTNYDQTVLALVMGGLERATAVERRPCTAMPLRRVWVVPLSQVSRDYLAALNLVLVEAKLADDLTDETFGRRWLARSGLRLIRGRARRGADVLREQRFDVDLVHGLVAWQAAAETLPSPSLCSLAAPSAELTGAIFAGAVDVTGRGEVRERLCSFGRALGAFVYVEDARIDRMSDRLRGRFNAIDACYGPSRGAAEVHRFQRELLLVLERELSRLQLGAQGAVLGHLLATLNARLARVSRSKEAGECDCGGCDGCSGGDGCGECGACHCGGTPGGCAGADTCCAPCDCLVWNREKRAARQQARRARVAALLDRLRARRVGAHSAERQWSDLLGKRGTTVSSLRPSGEAEIDGERVEVRTRGEYLAAGSVIVVIEASRHAVCVTAVVD